jgi:hypothetical protein
MVIKVVNSSALSRRAWVCTVAAGSLSLVGTDLFGASEFWNKRDPSTWTSDEVLLLATRSPWAKSARLLPTPHRDRSSIQPGPAEASGGLGRSGGRGSGPEPVIPVTEVTVVWESARPLVDAIKYKFPADFENHYVIGVNDLPSPRGAKRVNSEGMMATLEARGQEPVGAGAVQPLQGGSAILFGFSRELLPLSVSDREVTFLLKSQEFSVKAKFDPKEMVYRGMLAL